MKFTAESTVLIVCALFGVYVSLAESTILAREVVHGLSTALHKRQALVCSGARINEIVENFPQECLSVLSDVAATGGCDHQCVSQLCRGSCAQPFYDFLVECYDDPSVASVFEVSCSRNERGVLCIDTVSGLLEEQENELKSACDGSTTDSCSATCMEELRESNDETGCCLYTILAVATSQRVVDDIWGSCDVNTPGVCTSRFTGAQIQVRKGGQVKNDQVSVTSCIPVLVVALLMASATLY